MVDPTCELVWIYDFLIEMAFMPKTPMRLYCENWYAIYIVQNFVFHEMLKHIKVDCHVIRGKYDAGIIEPRHVSSANQFADLLTRQLLRSQGMQIVFQVGLALLKFCQDKLVSLPFEKLIHALRNFPEDAMNPDTLLPLAFSIKVSNRLGELKKEYEKRNEGSKPLSLSSNKQIKNLHSLEV